MRFRERLPRTGKSHFSIVNGQWRRSCGLKKNGERYRVSPWGLVWQNENYYLVACDEKCGRVKHYRVDKIMQIRLREGGAPRQRTF